MGLIIAGSSLQAKFTSYDEEGNRIWEPDGKQIIVTYSPSQIIYPVAPNVTDPVSDCSTLELISPDLWITLDGYDEHYPCGILLIRTIVMSSPQMNS